MVFYSLVLMVLSVDFNEDCLNVFQELKLKKYKYILKSIILEKAVEEATYNHNQNLIWFNFIIL